MHGSCRFRPLPLVCGVLLTGWLLAPGCLLSSAQEEETKTVPVAPGTTVRIKTRNGRIKVRPGKAGRVHIVAVKKARATSSPESCWSASRS